LVTFLKVSFDLFMKSWRMFNQSKYYLSNQL
jgi:hypothetical protein